MASSKRDSQRDEAQFKQAFAEETHRRKTEKRDNISRRRPVAEGTSNYLPEAPAALIALHRRIGSGKAILGRLLTDKRMGKAWTTLAARIKHDSEWRALWSEIVYALRLTKLDRPGLARKRKAFLSIATSARQLTESIENKPLDLHVFELFPEEVMRINGVNDWGGLNSLRRSDEAYRFLREWPTVSECLRELAARADKSAYDVIGTVPVERTTRDYKAIIFSRWLTNYFKRQLNQPLHTTLAAIATVVLLRIVTPDIVEQASRRRNKKK